MDRYSRKHLTDGALLTGFRANVANERGSLADVLADIGEIDERELYVPAAHPSMVSYMVHELRFTEQAAFKRLRAARTARRFPAILSAVADGRLNLSAVVLLASHLAPENVDELLRAAAGKSKTELERILSGSGVESDGQLPLVSGSQPVANMESQLSPGTVAATPHEPEACEQGIPPQHAERSEMRCQLDREAHELLEYARALLSHAIPNGDMGRIVARAAKALVRELEKQKFGATARPRKRRGSSDPRYIPLAVKREVWKRDGGQCSFHSEQGKRCPSRDLLEFHHIMEVALGGTASVEDIALRCRAHNQYESERTFGKAFMQKKREQAQAAAEQRKAEREAEREKAREATASLRAAKEAERATRAAETAAAAAKRQAERAAEDALDNDEAMPWLRGLGFTIGEARDALTKCGPTPELRLEARIKRCLSLMPIRGRRFSPNGVALS